MKCLLLRTRENEYQLYLENFSFSNQRKTVQEIIFDYNNNDYLKHNFHGENETFESKKKMLKVVCDVLFECDLNELENEIYKSPELLI